MPQSWGTNFAHSRLWDVTDLRSGRNASKIDANGNLGKVGNNTSSSRGSDNLGLGILLFLLAFLRARGGGGGLALLLFCRHGDFNLMFAMKHWNGGMEQSKFGANDVFDVWHMTWHFLQILRIFETCAKLAHVSNFHGFCWILHVSVYESCDFHENCMDLHVRVWPVTWIFVVLLCTSVVL